MFMLVSNIFLKVRYISCANDPEMWVLEEKESSILLVGLEILF